MNIELICIGDELLIGQTVNTNATWIGQFLRSNGYSVDYAQTIKDEEKSIRDAVLLAQSRAEFVIITGGLGPTKDDITKRVLADYFNTELVMYPEVLDRVKCFFEARGREMLEVNEQQALLPKDAEILENQQGTASGMLFSNEFGSVVSLPGVPYEMKHLMEKVQEILKSRFPVDEIYHETIHLQGIGESFLAERIRYIEDSVRAEGMALAYLPKPGIVRVRISGKLSKKDVIDEYLKSIESLLPRYAFGIGDIELESIVGKICRERDFKIGTVESCTGGTIAQRLVSIAGSSDYFFGSIVSYTNELKSELVGVDAALFETVGAVSKEVVEEMAVKGRLKLGVDYCISTSGIAGPTGGSLEKPVGTVWIAIAGPNGVFSKQFLFGNERKLNIEKTVSTALNLLRCEILGLNLEKSL